MVGVQALAGWLPVERADACGEVLEVADHGLADGVYKLQW